MRRRKKRTLQFGTREDQRRRSEIRNIARDERDAKLAEINAQYMPKRKALAAEHASKLREVWDEWRAARSVAEQKEVEAA